MKHRTLFLLLMITFFSIIAGCGNQSENQSSQNEVKEVMSNYPSNVKENPVVTITMDNDEQIMIELYPEVAPNTVANFVSLIEDGFYDGLIFHRVIPGFMIQGGDPNGTGAGGPGYSIEGEFSSNGFENNLAHEKGVISMARTMDPNSAGSQFFIMAENSSHLDGEYAAFGKVTEGLEVVDKIVSVDRDSADKPLEDQVMKSVAVDTKGFDYPEPEKVQ